MVIKMNSYKHNNTCRICLGEELIKVLDLGRTPPANAFLKEEELQNPEPLFPLALYFCKACSLVQILDVVDPEMLFKNYHFLTGASQPAVEHFQKYAQQVIKPFITSKNDLVVDIGGNDGVLLEPVKEFARVQNVDPADNLAPISEARGVPFYSAFFNSIVADDLLKQYGTAKVVTANNVFAHTDPIRDVFKGVAKLIGEEGTFIFEVHWVKHLIDEVAFDQIYHEHLCFYSLHALKWLVESAGMTLFDVEIIPMQGRSLRVYAAKDRPVSSRVAELLAEEERSYLTKENTFLEFGAKVEKNKEKLKNLLSDLKSKGKKIAGYGAPAKSTTLLNYYGIGPETISYIVDSTSLKQGLYTPGTHIPIYPPGYIHENIPDYVVIFAWNFKDAILEKEKALFKKGVKFIVAIPDIAIIESL